MRRFIFPIVALFMLVACETDDMNQIGSSVGNATFTITEDSAFTLVGSTVSSGHMYNNTTIQLLGKVDMPTYGNVSSSFMAQMVPSLRLDTNYVESVDSLVLNLRYSRTNGFVGDSLAPMQLSVYKLQQELNYKDMYCDIDPTPYYVQGGKSELLGRKSYTASDFHIPDSILAEDDYYYSRNISVVLPRELAQSFYDEYKTNPSTFDSQANFSKFFPGFYVESSFGSGALITFREVTLSMFYTKSKMELDNEELKDTVYQTVDKDFMAINNLAASVSAIRNSDPEWFDPNLDVVLKSPAALEAKIKFPVADIIDHINVGAENESQVLNALTFRIPADTIINNYDIEPPTYILFIRESQKDEFFINKRLPDATNYFYGVYSNGEYYFGDISGYVTNIMDSTSEASKFDMSENEDVLLIPVSIYTDTSTSSSVIKSVTPNYNFRMTKLRPEDAKIKVIYTTKE